MTLIEAAVESQVLKNTAPQGADEPSWQTNLTKNQYLIWMEQQLNPNLPVYNMIHTYRIKGPLDPGHFIRAFDALVQASDTLRTTVVVEQGIPHIRVAAGGMSHVTQCDLSKEADPEAAWEKWAAQRKVMVFKQDRQLYDCALVKLGENDFIWYWNQDHMACDAWSMSLIYRYVSKYYEQSLRGELSAQASLAAYASYAQRDQDYRNSPAYKASQSFWQEEFASPVDALTFYGRGQSHGSPRVARRTLSLGKERSQKLKLLAKKPPFASLSPHLSLFNMFSLCLATYMHKVSLNREIVIGSPIHNRLTPEDRETIGMFMEVVPIKINIEEHDSFRSLIDKYKKKTLKALQHYRYGTGKVGIYEVLLNYHNASYAPFAGMPTEVKWLHSGYWESKDPLTLQVHEYNEQNEICLEFDFNCGIFPEAKQDTAMQHFLKIVDALIEDDLDRPISELDILTKSEKDFLLHSFNDTQRELAPGLFFEHFAAQAQRTPDRVAVSMGDASLSYQEVHARAEELAHRLGKQGVGTETLVAILAERGFDFLVAVLACFKLRAAYIPLDPLHPDSRHLTVFQESRAGFVLLTAAFEPAITRLQSAHNLPLAILKIEAQSLSPALDLPLSSQAEPQDLAYTIFTSGSTGKPKGAMVEQLGMINHIWAKIEDLALTQDDIIAQNASQCFDISVWQLLTALVMGASTRIIPNEVAHDPEKLLAEVAEQGVTILEVVPSLLTAALNQEGGGLELPQLRFLIPTGEALSPQIANKWLARFPHVHLVNAYGPTECSDDVSHHKITRALEPHVAHTPIGKPIINTQLYVLDQNLRLLPLGVPGELYVGGKGVGRGYLNRPDLTAAAFCANPFEATGGSRLYKTGDLVRFQDQGCLEFLGRLDHQVKIRGNRIELGEIEARLMRHPDIKQLVVIAHSSAALGKHLVAYYESKHGAALEHAQLRQHIIDELPEYMAPAAFVSMQPLPLSANGKIDRKKLPSPAAEDYGTIGEFVAPRNELEQIIASVWEQVLKVERVGAHDNFFSLGGHSLLATQVASMLRQKLQLEVSLREVLQNPEVESLALCLEKARAATVDAIALVDRSGPLPLSVGQKTLWLINQLGNDQGVYNIPLVARYQGSFDADRYEAALAALIQRHEVLRSSFIVTPDSGGLPIQHIADQVSFKLSGIIDLKDAANPEAALKDLLQAEFKRPFDLTQAPLLRCTLVQLGEQDYAALYMLHHIIGDGRSIEIIKSEVETLYRNGASALPTLPVQFADFVQWQNSILASESYQQQLEQWLQQLAGPLPVFSLPISKTRPPKASSEGATLSFDIDKKTALAIRALSAKLQTTSFVTLSAIFKTLLYRYTRQTDLIVGMNVAGRPHHDFAPLIGYFVNMVALRTKLDPADTLTTLVAKVKEAHLFASSHQDLPFEQVVEQLKVPRDPSRHPIFQILLDYHVVEPLHHAVESVPFHNEFENYPFCKFDMEVLFNERAVGYSVCLNYNAALFDRESIVALSGHFQELLHNLLADPAASLATVQLLPSAERQLMLEDWNRTEHPLDLKIFHQVFEQRAAMHPQRVAASCGTAFITYEDLNRRANQLARALREHEARDEKAVAILADRGLEFLISMLACFKAGVFYIPLDPKHPADRYKSILEEASCQLVVVSEGYKNKLLNSVEGASIKVLPMENLLAAEHDASNLQLDISPGQLAYCIFTSGSTGKPKGALVENKGMINHLYAKVIDLGLSESDIIAQNASQCFDISVWQFLVALLIGAETRILPDEIAHDPRRLLDEVERYHISILEVVPSLLTAALEINNPTWALEQLRWLVPTGEALSPDTANKWLKHYAHIPLMNAYGPTECSDDVSHFPIHAALAPEVVNTPIGKPIINTKLYVLDEFLQPLPIGVPGELYIAGEGVGRGYLGREDLTSKAFVPNLFSPLASALMYKTGDLVKYLASGHVEFLGRIDHQVKIRGFRIELGEIEAEIAKIAGVVANVVVARDHPQVGKELLAYISFQAQQAQDPAFIKARLSEKLPDYMVPRVYISMEQLPLTPNGKVDRKALPEPQESNYLAQDFVAACSDSEVKLLKVWEEVFGFAGFGVNDNFFDLGGHSLMAMRILARLSESLNIDLPLAPLFEHQTIRELASWIDREQSAGFSSQLLRKLPLVPRSSNVQLPLSWAQKRMWMIDQLKQKNDTFNVVLFKEYGAEYQHEALQKTMNAIIARHENLRAAFIVEQGEVYQQIQAELSIAIPLIDLRADSQGVSQSQIITAEYETGFDLSHPPLLRAKTLQVADDRYKVIITSHHMISDARSEEVLLAEIAHFMTCFSEQRPASLEPLAIQYADYAVWQRQSITPAMIESQLSYWREHLSGNLPILDLPADFKRPRLRTNHGETFSFKIPDALGRQLKKIAQDERKTMFVVLLATFKVLLSRYSAQEDILVASLNEGRFHKDLEKLIGFFINTVVLRADLSGNPLFAGLLDQLEKVHLQAMSHQDVPFENILEALAIQRDPSRTPLAQVMFDYRLVEPLLMEGQTAAPLPAADALSFVDFDFNESKFDIVALVEEHSDGLLAFFNFNKDIYKRSTLEQMASVWVNLLEQISQDPRQPIDQYELSNSCEKAQLQAINATARPLPSGCAHELFEARAAQYPDKIAAWDGMESLSYSALNSRANRMARSLLQQNIAAGEQVAVLSERHVDLLASMLACWKIGAVYLPLDPAHPSARHLQILAESQTSTLLLDASELAKGRSYAPDLKILTMDALKADSQDASNICRPSRGEDRAFVIFTSGSTGQPKGAIVDHAGMINHFFGKIFDLGIDETDVIAQNASQGFVISLWQFAAALVVGAQVAIIPAVLAKDAGALFEAATRQNVSILELVPSQLQNLIEVLAENADFKRIRWIVPTGENLTSELARRWVRRYPQIPLLNAYGSSECSDDVCHYRIDASFGEEVITTPIGRPICNMEVFVMDRSGRLLPRGIPGELVVAGPGVGHGYLNRPELTALVFQEHPFKAGGARSYKTGDRVRMLADGTLECLGRIDHQIKIRGYRIEPGEVESAIQSYALVENAVVKVHHHPQRGSILAAWVVGRKGFTLDGLQDFLRQFLPEYMMPSALISMNALPQLSNGKVDRKALPEPVAADFGEQTPFVAPQTAIEKQIAKLWQETLGGESPGLHDNFFAAGGHSLRAVQLSARLSHTWNIAISLGTIFEQPTIAQLALCVSDALASSSQQTIDKIQSYDRSGDLPCSWNQKKMWMIAVSASEELSFNLVEVYSFKGISPVENVREIFQTALDRLVERHESLRTIFFEGQDQLLQRVRAAVPVAMDFLDLSDCPAEGQPYRVNQAMEAINAYKFNIENEQLVRGILMYLGDERYQLGVCVHHISSDADSLEVIGRELNVLVEELLGNAQARLLPLPIQYGDYAIWLDEKFKANTFANQLAYWLDKLGGDPPIARLPFQKAQVNFDEARFENVCFEMPPELLEKCRELSYASHSSMHMLMLAALKALIYRYTHISDLTIGIMGSMRDRLELENLIGAFVNNLAIRTQLSEQSSFLDAINLVRKNILAARENHHVPFDFIADELFKASNKPPEIEIVFDYRRGETLEEIADGDVLGLTLEVTFIEASDHLVCNLSYNSALFDRSSIENFASHFEGLLASMVEGPKQPIQNLAFVKDNEISLMVDTLEQALAQNPSLKTLAETASPVAGQPLQPALCNARGLWVPATTLGELCWQDPTSGTLLRTGLYNRIYPSGSVGSWLRNDQVVSFGGMPIELPIVEESLLASRGVRAATVVIRSHNDKEKIVGFLVVDQAIFNMEETVDHVAIALPQYMLPEVFFLLDENVLNAEGSIDLDQLPDLLEAYNPATRLPQDASERLLVTIFNELLARQDTNVSASFFDIGGNSLLAMRLINRINEKFALTINLRTIFDNPTIESLAKFIREVNPLTLQESPLLETFREGPGTPLFLVHSSGGHAFGFKDFSNKVDGFSVYGINAIGVATDELPPSSIEEFARRYIELIQARVPHGPYRLGGYSAGAVIALEMAHQLQAQGEAIEDLVIFDGSPEYEGHSELNIGSYLKVPPQHVKQFLAYREARPMPKLPLSACPRVWDDFAAFAIEKEWPYAKLENFSIRIKIARLEWSLHKAFHSYKAKGISIPVWLFKPGMHLRNHPLEKPLNAWEDLQPKPEIKLVYTGGHHLNLLRKGASIIAKALMGR